MTSAASSPVPRLRQVDEPLSLQDVRMASHLTIPVHLAQNNLMGFIEKISGIVWSFFSTQLDGSKTIIRKIYIQNQRMIEGDYDRTHKEKLQTYEATKRLELLGLKDADATQYEAKVAAEVAREESKLLQEELDARFGMVYHPHMRLVDEHGLMTRDRWLIHLIHSPNTAGTIKRYTEREIETIRGDILGGNDDFDIIRSHGSGGESSRTPMGVFADHALSHLRVTRKKILPCDIGKIAEQRDTIAQLPKADRDLLLMDAFVEMYNFIENLKLGALKNVRGLVQPHNERLSLRSARLEVPEMCQKDLGQMKDQYLAYVRYCVENREVLATIPSAPRDIVSQIESFADMFFAEMTCARDRVLDFHTLFKIHLDCDYTAEAHIAAKVFREGVTGDSLQITTEVMDQIEDINAKLPYFQIFECALEVFDRIVRAKPDPHARMRAAATAGSVLRVSSPR